MLANLPDFSTARVLVIGDVMLDRYWSGQASRISPEAPVPVVKVKTIEERVGGAANVALNIAKLGGKVTLIGARDVPSQLAVHSSKLYAQNVVSLLTLITKDGEVTPDISDEVIAGSALVFAGEVKNATAREQLGLPALEIPAEGN